MAEQTNPDPTREEGLAEILWDARKISLGDRDGEQPFGEASPRIREQYRRFAAEVAKRLTPDPDDELEQLRARVAELEEDAATLSALRSAGVDNWDGYAFAMELAAEREEASRG